MEHQVPSSLQVRSNLCPNRLCFSISAADMGTTSHRRSSHTGNSQTRRCSFSLGTAFRVRLPLFSASPRSIDHQPPTGCLSSYVILRLISVFPDLSAAKHADVLFVKEKSDGENDLATFCTRENIPHVLFSDFSKALPVVRSIVKGDKTPKEWFDIGRA